MTDGQSASQAFIWELWPICILFFFFSIFRRLRVCWCGPPSLKRRLCIVYSWQWASPAQSFLSLSPAGLRTIFYCLKFETPATRFMIQKVQGNMPAGDVCAERKEKHNIQLQWLYCFLVPSILFLTIIPFSWRWNNVCVQSVTINIVLKLHYVFEF
jgi:hypothetical protein